MEKLPAKTVERLSEYRRTLINCLNNGKKYIYSHELAQLHHKTAVQVRRDIMLMGFSGIQRKGYKIREMIEAIGRILDCEAGQNVAIVGIGHLGTAILHYFIGKRPKLRMVAIFDVDMDKVDKEIHGVSCYHADKIPEVIPGRHVDIGIITVPPEYAKETADRLIDAGIRGILNFTTVPLRVPDHVYLEEYDMITSLEKVAYFARKPK